MRVQAFSHGFKTVSELSRCSSVIQQEIVAKSGLKHNKSRHEFFFSLACFRLRWLLNAGPRRSTTFRIRSTTFNLDKSYRRFARGHSRADTRKCDAAIRHFSYHHHPSCCHYLDVFLAHTQSYFRAQCPLKVRKVLRGYANCGKMGKVNPPLYGDNFKVGHQHLAKLALALLTPFQMMVHMIIFDIYFFAWLLLPQK